VPSLMLATVVYVLLYSGSKNRRASRPMTYPVESPHLVEDATALEQTPSPRHRVSSDPNIDQVPSHDPLPRLHLPLDPSSSSCSDLSACENSLPEEMRLDPSSSDDSSGSMCESELSSHLSSESPSSNSHVSSSSSSSDSSLSDQVILLPPPLY
jgi:hypothetical protein